MFKTAIFILGLMLGTVTIAYAAPSTQNFTNIQPFTTDTYTNGTGALEWLNFFTKNATVNNLIVSGAAGSTGCATFSITGVLSNTGTPCGTGSGGVAYPFTPSFASTTPTSATSTAIDDSAGLFIQGSAVATSTVACPDGQTVGCSFTGPNSVQAAMAAGYNTVYMKNGTYTISQPILPTRSGFVLKGEGNGTIINYNGFTQKVAIMTGNPSVELSGMVFENFEVQETLSGGRGTCLDISHIVTSKVTHVRCDKNLIGFMASTSQSYYNTFDTDDVTHLTSTNGSLTSFGFYFGDNGSGDGGPINTTIINPHVSNFINGSSTSYYINSHTITCINCDSESGYIGMHVGPSGSGLNAIVYLEANKINLTIDASSAQVGSYNIGGEISSARSEAEEIVDSGAAGLCVNARVSFAAVNYCTNVKQGFGTKNPRSVLEVSNEAESATPALSLGTLGLFGNRGTAISLDFQSGASWSGRQIVNPQASVNFPTLDFVLSTSTAAGGGLTDPLGVRFVQASSIGTGDIFIQPEASSSGYAVFEGRATSTATGPLGTMISSEASPVILAPNRIGVIYVATNGNTSMGTSSASGKLTIWGKDTSANTNSLIITNSASTTLFRVNNTGIASTTGLIVSNSGGTAGCATFAADGTISNTGAVCGSTGTNGTATTSFASTYPITLTTTTAALTYGLSGLATTTATCSSGASCTPFTIIGSSPITITSSGSGSSGGGWSFITGAIFNSTTTDQVMIGENSTTTTAKLEVNGATAIKGIASSTSVLTGNATINLGNNQVAQFNDNTNASGFWGLSIGFLSQSGLAEITTNGQALSFFTGGTRNTMTPGTERARFTLGGAFGIATTTPKEQLSVASTSAPQLGLLSGVNSNSWVFRNQASGDLWVGTSTLSGATSTSPAFSLDSNAGFTIPSLASGGTSCVQVDSTGKFSITGSGCASTTGFITTTAPWTVGQLAMVSDATHVTSVATSTLTPTTPLTGSFITIGSGALGIQAASASQDGYLAQTNFQLLHAATTTFTAPLVYTLGTNAVTCTNASSGVTGCLSASDWALLHTATTTFSSPLVYTQSTNAVTCPTCVVTPQAEHHSFSYSTSTWAGTTTIQLETGYDEVWNSVRCYTNIGNLNMKFINNASALNQFTASTTNGIIAFTTNNTMTASNKVSVDIGTPASSPTVITCTIKDTPV